MAIAEHAAGTQTATINTEHVLNTTTPETTDGVYQLYVDLANMVIGERVEIRVKEKVGAATTQRLVFLAVQTHAQDEPAFVTPALVLLHGWDMTLKQTAGTGRSFPWSIRKIT